MTTESPPESEARVLEIVIDSRRLPVSYLSSLLRVVQAAVREVARRAEGSRQSFDQQPQPVLHMEVDSRGEELALLFSFADPVDSSPLREISAAAFDDFVDQFAQLLKGLPQRGLWGGPVGGAQAGRYDSEVYTRLDQVRLEMRRFTKARLSFGDHVISFEGDRMEID